MLRARSDPVFQPIGAELLDGSLQDVLVQQARKHAGRVAVVDPGASLTYSELLSASASVSERIMPVVAASEFRIGLLFDQDVRYVVALLGVLRSGGAFVPLDARRGRDWNAEVVTTAKCSMIIGSEEHAGLARQLSEQLSVPMICIGVDDEPAANADICISRPPDRLACIYFTSGTTGAPKGVCDVHRNLLHNAMRYTNTLLASSADKMSLIQAPIFSGTQSTIFIALINGATLYSFDVARHGLPGLPDWLIDQGVTMFHAVPSIFRMLALENTRYDAMRLVRIEGDRATHEDVRVLRAHFPDDCTLVNGLGATECGLVRQFFIEKNTSVAVGDLPLGFPVPDMEVSIVDEHGKEVASGVVGEVKITSKYLAPGYLDRPELTHSKFGTGDQIRRSYLTGDIGHLDENGCLWLSGRSDQQIKINGVTVNLPEIETALSELPFVRHGLVAQRFNRRDQSMLVAYLVPNSGSKPDLGQVRQSLADRLPPHHRPTRIVWLESLPVSLDGKFDRAALPQPASDRPELDTRYVAPGDDIELALVRIWQTVMEIAPIGVHDDLLMLGCDSLSIVLAANRIRSELGAEVNVPDLFNKPTISALAGAIRSDGRSRGR